MCITCKISNKFWLFIFICSYVCIKDYEILFLFLYLFVLALGKVNKDLIKRRLTN